ncbi:hypothetical protein [Microtetraspora malaysiensis]|uniref:hypothetical protein n=1 Tax=Microtetraspora malaysiensis TaxID=161358 RepID=UPI003D947169
MNPVERQEELRYFLNQWDPIGVYDEELDFPPDEYDCLIGPVLARLSRGAGPAELSEYLWYELEDHFGLEPVPGQTDGIAAKLVLWYRHGVERTETA